MAYTEIKIKNSKKYYYRVRSIREGDKFKKERIYLGVNLTKENLIKKEEYADKKLIEKKIQKGLIKIKPKLIFLLKKKYRL